MNDEFLEATRSECPYLCAVCLEPCTLLPRHIRDCECAEHRRQRLADTPGRTVTPAPNFQPPQEAK